MTDDPMQVLTEFCDDNPHMLRHIRYRKIPCCDEPVPILDSTALEEFRLWELEREYVAAQSTLLGRITWWLWCLWMMRPMGSVNVFPDVVFPQFRRRP